ncbi:hypothetical protein DPMN_045123 [Dreissena polymorpha]|uniref:EF-hand domain-containing protein n=1 Tax=Dreissena polymorpha TaxID=45954 RepID=A0A9D4HZC9_DREPO|nr:hypothetical protein DPMN_045123 [Dreissena polymorpha]
MASYQLTILATLAALFAICAAQGTSVDLKLSGTGGGGARLDGGINHDLGRGWSIGASGYITSGGAYGGSVGVKLRFRREAAHNSQKGKYFDLHVQVDQCNFNLYDANRDDVITKDELISVYGETTLSEELFETLDVLTGDGHIERAEFDYMVPIVVERCDRHQKQ